MKKTKITRIMMSLVVLSAIVVAGGETKEVNASQIVPESRIEQLSDVYKGSYSVSAQSLKEIKPGNINESEYNRLERTPIRKMYIDLDKMPEGAEDSEADNPNTDPNNAYVLSDNTVWNGTIEKNNELRWYAFNATTKSKLTIFLQMVDSLDSDLYLFSYHTETSSLSLIAGSATQAAGTEEKPHTFLDKGTYFVAVSGYDSTGNYAFAFYQSSADVENEVNDSSANATTLEYGTTTGVIDNPRDLDYYKITVSKPTIIKYSIESSEDYSFLYAGKEGDSSAVYKVNKDTKTYKIMPGTYYYAVCSKNGKYSSTDKYTIKFVKIGEMSGNSSITKIGISEDAGIVYETNDSGTVNYVNGNAVDINYSYENTLSNSAGLQSYSIKIDPAGARVLFSEEYEPAAVHYYNSTRPAMNVSSRPALMLTFYNESNFYHIHCLGTGAYADNTLSSDLNNVTVLIDPATGKLIDIVTFNYYYDFAPVGTNHITWTRSYKMNYYSN